MPRTPRIEYAGAIYHVMCRGDRREPIYEDDTDRGMFLKTVGECCQRSGFRILSYVLMSNHYHLLLETPQGNLVAGMTWLQSTYTVRFNARHKQRGHVFQGRYKAIAVDPDEPEYARVVSDYIHLNPARAGLVNERQPELIRYLWSSFPAICSGQKHPEWLHGEEVLNCHGWSGRRRRERLEYQHYLQKRAKESCMRPGEHPKEEDEERYQQIRRGWYIGGGGFRERLEGLVGKVVWGRKRSSYAGEELRRHDVDSAGKLLKQGLLILGLSAEEVRKLPKNDRRKQGLAWLVKSNTVVGDEWVQKELHMGHRSNISRAVSLYREEENREIKKLKRTLHKCTD